MNDDPTTIIELAEHASTDVQTPGSADPRPGTKTLSVGVFDSGIGGFTVAGAINRLRPDLNIVYFGDSLNMPYGGRPLEQIASFAKRAIEFLLDQGMDILAVGCNASNSVLGQGELKSFGVPVYDLVGSTIDWLRGTDEVQSIGLIATKAAINSGYWERKLNQAFPELPVRPVAAPKFVPLVEAQDRDERAIRTAVKEYIQPLVDDGVTHVLHGCTHYPLLEPYMVELSAELRFIDPAQCLAEKLNVSLAPATPAASNGKLRLFSSLPGETFYSTGERVFGRSIRQYTFMYIVNPHED